MSYNIDSVEILSSSNFRVHRNKAKRAAAKAAKQEWAPECSPFEDLTFGEDGYAALARFWFYGEGSGAAWSEGVFDIYAKATEGEADLLVTWEGGDSFSGVRIHDGKMTRHKVVMTLGEEEPDDAD